MLSATAMPTQADAGRWGGRLARALPLPAAAPAAAMIHVVRIATSGPKRAAGRLSDQTLGARGRPEAGPRCLERPCRVETRDAWAVVRAPLAPFQEGRRAVRCDEGRILARGCPRGGDDFQFSAA